MNMCSLTLTTCFAAILLTAAPNPRLVRPGSPDWPVAWISYRAVKSMEEDFADLKAHGVGLASVGTASVEECRRALATARRFGMKLHIEFPDITEDARVVRAAGLEPVDAIMIGGVYRGKAIDRHVFAFTAGKQEIVIEPPVYDRKFAYSRGGSSFSGPGAKGEPIAHYFPNMPDPVRAEIVVPLRAFDGKQHLKIIPAQITRAAAGAKIEHDSVTADLPPSSETAQRRLFRLSFDLTGLESARLDQVGIAVYWPYHGYPYYWMFGSGLVSAAADSTRDALRLAVRKSVRVWSEANGGEFPVDTVIAARFGDECFFTTGHILPNADTVSYPLWEYSAAQIAAYRKHAGTLDFPRTWGFPEIYGPDAYAWWQYAFHEKCAELAGLVREEVARSAPGLLIFRNTTRAGVFALGNDHDGSGPELLTRNLDLVHLDPYPVTGNGYQENTIPTDMSYYAGLARRYRLPLVPWLQAHAYGGPTGLVDPSPEQVDHMVAQHLVHGVDAIIWLGYGKTFPAKRPESWERAGEIHRKLAQGLPSKPRPKLAVLRSYRAWALASYSDGKLRNPGDWMLQQLLDIWVAKFGLPYDVFELAPSLSPVEQARLRGKLKEYPYVVSNVPFEGAWVLGQGMERKSINPSDSVAVRADLEMQLRSRGWIGR
jgi:hypothetical protein